GAGHYSPRTGARGSFFALAAATGRPHFTNNKECGAFALRTKTKRRGAFYMRPDGLAQGTRPRANMGSASYDEPPRFIISYLFFIICEMRSASCSS
uniref:hypothetical protein n=1 Tax=Gemmiger formicilis TaxID=745368 RepID=UPI004026CB00